MTAFSEKEFNIMVDELLVRETPSFDMLCYIAETSLRKQVRHWCATDFLVGGKNVDIENDIMQEIHIRLIKTTVTSFLLKDSLGGEINNDPEGFNRWMFTVAKRITFDHLKRFKARSTSSIYDDEGKIIDIPDEGEDIFSDDDQKQMLCKSFDIVLSADIKVYKILTWLALSLIVLNRDISKIKSTEYLVAVFNGKTLFEIKDIVFGYAEKISWLTISDCQKQKIENSLNEAYDLDRVWGEVKFEECIMKKGDKKSVSDWVNRINNMIKRGL